MTINLPRPGDQYDPQWAADLVRELENNAAEQAQPAGTGYTTPANLTATRTFDADATSTAELADVLGTLIEDLKSKGIIEK